MIPSRAFGSNGPAVGIVGQGSWQIEQSPRAALRALRRGVALGLNHVDTAALYGNGSVERLVGRALAGRRDQVFLVSKIDPRQASRRGTVRACEASLRRLRTDRLDACLLHWVGPHPLAETIEGFEALVAAGKIGRWGVSNFDELRLAEALAIAGPGRIACNQVLYHLGQRAIEHAVLPFCQTHGIALVGYSPFGAGAPGALGIGAEGSRTLGRVAAARGATVRQVALAFLVHRAGTFVIPKAADAAHLEENVGAATLTLDANDLAAIARAFPLGERQWGVPLAAAAES